jgi:hypothetical protein
MGKKLVCDYECAGPLVAEYIQGKQVNWGRVADSIQVSRKTLDEDRIHAIKQHVMALSAQGGRERLGCGQPMKALFEKVPADGKMHAVTCPKCGMDCNFEHFLAQDEEPEEG